MQSAFVSSVPTAHPSRTPSKAPVTSIPTQTPTKGGLISTLTLTKTVTDNIPQDELNNIESQVINTFGVYPEDVSVDVSYTNSGSIFVDVPDDVDADTIAQDLANSIAKALGNFISLPRTNVVFKGFF